MRYENVVSIARFVFQAKEYLAAIHPVKGVFVLSTMLFADEIVPAQKFTPYMGPVDLSDKELNMVKMLIQSQTTDFKLEHIYKNQYNKQVLELIDRKSSEQMVTAQQTARKAVDLMGALEMSIKLAKAEKKKIDRPKRTKKDTPA